jgi:hypothetical protein
MRLAQDAAVRGGDGKNRKLRIGLTPFRRRIEPWRLPDCANGSSLVTWRRMSKDTLIAKYETLPVVAQKQVEIFIEFLSKTTPTKPARSAKRRFKFDWAGGLADLKRRFTAVELQHHLNELR